MTTSEQIIEIVNKGANIIDGTKLYEKINALENQNASLIAAIAILTAIATLAAIILIYKIINLKERNKELSIELTSLKQSDNIH